MKSTAGAPARPVEICDNEVPLRMRVQDVGPVTNGICVICDFTILATFRLGSFAQKAVKLVGEVRDYSLKEQAVASVQIPWILAKVLLEAAHDKVRKPTGRKRNLSLVPTAKS